MCIVLFTVSFVFECCICLKNVMDLASLVLKVIKSEGRKQGRKEGWEGEGGEEGMKEERKEGRKEGRKVGEKEGREKTLDALK